MKKLVLLVSTVCFLTAVYAKAQAITNTETFVVKISGFDKGLAIVTFHNGGTLDGYGISMGSFGSFDFSGTWTNGEKDTIGGVVSTDLTGGLTNAPYSGSVKNGKLTVKGGSATKKVSLKGVLATSVPDISGTWPVVVSAASGQTNLTLNIISNPGQFGLFHFNGSISSGELIVDAKGNVYGGGNLLIRDWSVKGKVDAAATKLKLSGKADNGNSIKISGTR